MPIDDAEISPQVREILLEMYAKLREGIRKVDLRGHEDTVVKLLAGGLVEGKAECLALSPDGLELVQRIDEDAAQ